MKLLKSKMFTIKIIRSSKIIPDAKVGVQIHCNNANKEEMYYIVEFISDVYF